MNENISNANVFILGFIPKIRTTTKTPETFEMLDIKIIRSIPPGFERADLVADSYLEISLKEREQQLDALKDDFVCI